MIISIPMRIKVPFLNFLFLILLGGFSLGAFAQENDFQVWTDFTLNKELNKKWDVSFEQNLRAGNNVSQLSKAYSNLSAGYDAANFLKLSVLYRFVLRNKTDYFAKGHSFAFDATLKHKFSRVKLTMRNRFMLKYSEILSSDNGKIPERYYRTKLSMAYNIRKFPLSPSLAVESFLLIPKGDPATFDAFRALFGLGYSISKHQEIDAYWLNEWGLNAESGSNNFVLGLSYNYSF
jgi:hypothetical protein